jgi:predicted nucleic acid-binding protein
LLFDLPASAGFSFYTLPNIQDTKINLIEKISSVQKVDKEAVAKFVHLNKKAYKESGIQIALPKQVLLDTDVLLSYPKNLKLLEVLQNSICFTTFINASELLSKTTKKELLYPVSTLGFHYRYSIKLGEIIKKTKAKKLELRDMIMAVMMIETKLPVLTLDIKRYDYLSAKFNLNILHFKSL